MRGSVRGCDREASPSGLASSECGSRDTAARPGGRVRGTDEQSEGRHGLATPRLPRSPGLKAEAVH